MPDAEEDVAERVIALLDEHVEDYPNGCGCEGYRASSRDVFRHRDEWRAHRDVLIRAALTGVTSPGQGDGS